MNTFVFEIFLKLRWVVGSLVLHMPITGLDNTEIYLGPKQYPGLRSRVFSLFVLQDSHELPIEIF